MIRRLTALLARRRVIAFGSAGLVLGIAVFGSPALAYFSNTTSAQTMTVATGTYSCFTRTPADTPWFYYAFDESSGSSLVDSGSNGNTGTINGGTRSAGTCAGGTSPALTLASGDGGAVSPKVTTVPTSFTEETWFKTTTTTGGVLFAFGDAASGASVNKDRILYMTNSGTLSFGIYDGATEMVTSSTAYNDGAWHLVDAVLSATAGMALYVDGVSVGTDTTHKVAQTFGSGGYWRIGYDAANGWPSPPTSNTLIGSMEDTAVYNAALTSAQITAHMGASEVAPCSARTPVDSPYLYYSYNSVSGTTVPDSGAGGNTGSLTSGSATAVACTSGASPVLTLTAGNGGVASPATTEPTTFTLETWFNSTTTQGGVLIGYSNLSTGIGVMNPDANVYMTNSGTIDFGLYNGANGGTGYHTLTTPAAYNDGLWHVIDASVSTSTGMSISVDGVKVASNASWTNTRAVGSGYWRIGQNRVSGWPDEPSSATFQGQLDDTAVFTTALSTSQLAAHLALPR